MQVKEKKIEKVEIKKIYVADDGTEFATEEQCKSYEQTAKFAIECMLKKLNQLTTYNFVNSIDELNTFGYDDTMYAIEIRNTNDVETVNKWVLSHGDCNKDACIGTETIGTIQLFDCWDDASIWNIGTPDDLKARYAKGVDKLIEGLICWGKTSFQEGEQEK